MKKTLLFSLLVLAGVGISFSSCANYNEDSTGKSPADEAAIKLPAGFTITEVATGLKTPRHLVVNAKGDVFVKLGDLQKGNGIILLQNANKDGKFRKIMIKLVTPKGTPHLNVRAKTGYTAATK